MGDGDETVYLVLLPQLAISLLSWAQIVLAINRYRGLCRFTAIEMWSLLLFLHSGFVRWIAALAIRSSSVMFQVSASCVGAILGWASFVVVFNEDFLLPTRQQTWALMITLMITALWEVNNRLIFSLPPE